MGTYIDIIETDWGCSSVKRLLVITLMLSCLISFPAHAEPTTLCDPFVFYGLFVQRFNAFAQEYELDISISPDLVIPMTEHSDGLFSVETCAGTLWLDDETLEIKSALLTFGKDRDYTNYTSKNVVSCLAAMSALEYIEIRANAMQRSFNYGHSLDAASVFEILALWYQDGGIMSKVELESISESESPLIYSGNYDYYLEKTILNVDGKPVTYYFVSAESR